jgi:Mrp family chromosome partitioning ATPase
MADQAEKLRELVRSKSAESLPDAALRIDEREMAKTERRARIVAVTSGKGGVGKTSISTNLAIELALLGKRVTIFDADLSLANIDVLLGLRPRFNLNHVINGDKTLGYYGGRPSWSRISPPERNSEWRICPRMPGAVIGSLPVWARLRFLWWIPRGHLDKVLAFSMRGRSLLSRARTTA